MYSSIFTINLVIDVYISYLLRQVVHIFYSNVTLVNERKPLRWTSLNTGGIHPVIYRRKRLT